MELVPHDVVVSILQRLAPRSLAVSRCVCREWRGIVDARCHLRKDLLPVWVGGIFVGLGHDPAPPVFLARPSSTGRPKIAARLEDYVEMPNPLSIQSIINCCNGLLLLDGRVVNPATRQWVRLPPCPAMHYGGFRSDACLAFDPTVSPHYEVLLIDNDLHYTTLDEGSEWPPSPFMIPVYSSRTGAWETKPFVREGDAAGTIADVRSAEVPAHCHAVYRRETLYVHCKGDYIMR